MPNNGESACSDFRPLDSVYCPIGLLYRPMAASICVNCSRPKVEHSGGGHDGS